MQGHFEINLWFSNIAKETQSLTAIGIEKDPRNCTARNI